jgi:hypothetical protein
MQIHVYYESWVRQWVAYDQDQVDIDHTGPVAWADTKEEAVKELMLLIDEQGVA